MVRLQTEPIDTGALLAAARGDEDGAVALFVGPVRDHNQGRRVLRLEYSAYPEMAGKEMQAIVDQAIERFSVTRVALVHRTGTLEIGEASVAVAVGSPHRAQAFDACRFVMAPDSSSNPADMAATVNTTTMTRASTPPRRFAAPALREQELLWKVFICS